MTEQQQSSEQGQKKRVVFMCLALLLLVASQCGGSQMLVQGVRRSRIVFTLGGTMLAVLQWPQSDEAQNDHLPARNRLSNVSMNR